MGKLLAQVMADRAARDAARFEFDAHYEALKADIEARGLAGRIADEALEKAQTIFDEAVDVVESHPGVVGGTILALVLWILRNSVVSWVDRLVEPAREWLEELEREKH